VCSLIVEGRISTTVTKAKQIRRLAEKMITLGKKGTLHARRLAIAKLHQPGVVAQLFSEVAPRHEHRDGGYTRIMRLGNRLGDAAEMCVLEFVEEAVKESGEEPPTEEMTTGEEEVEETAADPSTADE